MTSAWVQRRLRWGKMAHGYRVVLPLVLVLVLVSLLVCGGAGGEMRVSAAPPLSPPKTKAAEPATSAAVAPRVLVVTNSYIVASGLDTTPRTGPLPDCTLVATLCTLREAILVSNANNPGAGTNKITFTGVTGTILLDTAQGTLDITKTLVIQGPGQNVLALDGGCTAGCGTVTPTGGIRVLMASLAGLILTVNDLTIQNGVATGTFQLGSGGGIAILGGGDIFNGTNLTFVNNTANVTDAHTFVGGGGLYTNHNANLIGVTFTHNATTSYGGGTYIEDYGVLTDVTATNNTATLNGGSLAYNFPFTATNPVVTGNTAGDVGGGIYANDATNITNAVITGNTAQNDGGGFYGESSYKRTFVNLTVSGNTSTTGNGGGFWEAGTTTVANGTFANNHANSGIGGGVYSESTAGAFNLVSGTISGNVAQHGGGVGIGTTAGITLTDTIVAQNTLSGTNPTGPDLYSTNTGTFAGTSNIIGDGSSQGGSGGKLLDGVANNRVGTTAQPFVPLLGPLGNYGSPTLPGGAVLQTLPLLPGSAAIDTGNSCTTYSDRFNNSTAMLTTDARGTGFPRVVNSVCDVGAFETGGFTFSGNGNQSAGLGQPFANPLAVTATPNHPGDAVAGGVVGFTLTPGTASATFAASGGSSCTVIGSNLFAGCVIPAGGVVTSPTVTAGTGAIGTLTANVITAGAPNTTSFTLSVTLNTTSTAVTAIPNPVTAGQSVALTATVTTTATGVGTPAGTVTFTSGGNTLGSGLVLLNGSGVATVSTTALPVGADTITATYSGNATFATGSGMTTETVNTAVLTLTAPTGSGSGNTGSATMAAIRPGANFTLITRQGSIPATGVTYTSSNPNVANVDPITGVVTGLSNGTAIITANGPNGTTGTMTVTVTNSTGGGLTAPNPQPMAHATSAPSTQPPAPQPTRATNSGQGAGGVQPHVTGGTRTATPLPQPAQH